MKPFSFILAALLAINVLAVVPFYERRDVELPPGAYWEGNTVVLPNTYGTAEEDGDNGHQLEHGIQERAVDDRIKGAFNRTALTQSGPNWGTDAYAVDVRVSKDHWSHVGTLRKYRLWKAIYDCLKQIAEPSSDDKRERCSYQQPSCTFHCKIPNAIVYEDGPNNYATHDAHLTIQDDWSELIESKHPGIRNLAYKFIADIWRLHSDNEGSCHTVNFQGSRGTKLCNVPHNVLVVWPARGDQGVQGRVNLQLQTKGVVASSDFFCEGPMAAINSHFSTNVVPEMSKVMGWPEDKIRLFNSCQKEECFDTRGGEYQDKKPWKEPKGCDPPLEPVNL